MIIILIVTILVQHLVISNLILKFEMTFFIIQNSNQMARIFLRFQSNGRNSLNKLHAQERAYAH
jgi:hypothetical protein